MPLKLDSTADNFEEKFTEFLNQNRHLHDNVDSIVTDILKNVATHGDQAVLKYTKEFDHWDTDDYHIDPQLMQKCFNTCDREYLLSIENAVQRVRDFHERTFPKGVRYSDEDHGVELGTRYTPVSATGVYIPGGKASYPSSAYMSIVPAQMAGVARIVAVVPRSGKEFNPLVLATLHYLEITEAYAIGGAHAIAALAYGTETIKAVDMIAGPGNIYVSTAKKQLFGHVGIDMIAGPTELVVVSDNHVNPEWIALDLLAQSEHDEMAQPTLISMDQDHLDAVEKCLNARLPTLKRRDIIAKSWEKYGTFIKVDHLDVAAKIIDAIAPEHLQIILQMPYDFAHKIHHAGAIFLGKYTPCALGDYNAGPSHVLPTNGSARFNGGLTTRSFMKRTSIIECSKDSLSHFAPHTAALAEAEGLEAHMLTVLARLDLLD